MRLWFWDPLIFSSKNPLDHVLPNVQEGQDLCLDHQCRWGIVLTYVLPLSLGWDRKRMYIFLKAKSYFTALIGNFGPDLTRGCRLPGCKPFFHRSKCLHLYSSNSGVNSWGRTHVRCVESVAHRNWLRGCTYGMPSLRRHRCVSPRITLSKS